MRIVRNAIIAFGLVPSGASLSAQTAWVDSSIDSLLKDRVNSKRSTGILLGIVEPGRAPKIFAATQPGVALDGNSVFEIGSVTKVFTTALLADMVQRGEVKLDDPVSRYLPSSVRAPARGGKQITLLDLATQSSGLPRLPTNLKPANVANPYADYSVQQLYDFLSSYELPRDIGSKFEYSNLGMGLLGHVLALRAGKSYETLVTERILQPLGMRDTHIILTPAMRARLAVGHDDSGAPVGNWDLPTLAGAGALRSTANDMLKFLAANLDSTSGPVAKALFLAHAPLRPTEAPQMRIGLAWLTLNAYGTPVVWHNGQTGGYHSFIGFDPARRRGVVILANSTNNIDDIGMHLLDERVPLTPSIKIRKEISVAPSVLAQYVGVYQLAPNFEMSITTEGNSLYGQATGQPRFQLFAETETDFFLKVVDAQITFMRNVSGQVDQLILHQGGSNIPGKRVK